VPTESNPCSCRTIVAMDSDRPTGVDRPPTLTPTSAIASRGWHGFPQTILNLGSSAYVTISKAVPGRTAIEISSIATPSTPAFASSCATVPDGRCPGRLFSHTVQTEVTVLNMFCNVRDFVSVGPGNASAPEKQWMKQHPA
jgi:hypothetical protein